MRHEHHGDTVALRGSIAQNPHEHATHISDYLRKALLYIHSAEDQTVPKSLIRTMIAAMRPHCQFRNIPDISAVMQALIIVQNDLKTTAEAIQPIEMRAQQNTATHQQVPKLS
jgi:hypothetical protein